MQWLVKQCCYIKTGSQSRKWQCALQWCRAGCARGRTKAVKARDGRPLGLDGSLQCRHGLHGCPELVLSPGDIQAPLWHTCAMDALACQDAMSYVLTVV